jgi:hypothetical protein
MQRGLVCVAACFAGWLTVVSFNANYFEYFEKTGGENAHITYHSAAVDPKIAALAWAKARTADPIIYVKEWRSYWPVQYVGSADPKVRVISMMKMLWTGGHYPQQFDAFLAEPGNPFIADLKSGKGCVIGFVGDDFDAHVRRVLAGSNVMRRDFSDASGAPIVSLWYVEG